MSWKIECDSLTLSDLETLGRVAAQRLPAFSAVEGVPRGGVRFGEYLKPHIQPEGPILIVDDVLTTGASMEEQRTGRENCLGLVIFSHIPPPDWVRAIFTFTL